jgi:hypothetical protein
MGHIDEASSSSQEMSREHKTDKNGNFRYFDSESEEEVKASHKPKGSSEPLSSDVR